MPYRAGYVGHEKKVAEPGIVADMVRQFADKHAFLRELVQNGLDAGATRIDVRIERDDRGVVRTSVTDDGAGMTRAIIEGPLLTLFSSSKEDDATKIGKYGIGFVSVFALEPDHVEVLTATATEGWLVRLFGDHAWELESASAQTRGTTVTLVHSMTPDVFAAHVEWSLLALRRWCRHARVPLDAVVLDAADPAATRRVAIQEPLDVAGLARARWEEGGEQIVVGVGGTEVVTSGFFNRGLTLHESPSTDLIDGVRIAIDSPKLSHTLSRDNVVRDGELRRLLHRAEQLVRGPLGDELLARLASAAQGDASADYASLLEAAALPIFEKRRSKIVVPLVDAMDQRTRLLLSDLDFPILVAAGSSPLTRALARTGQPVVAGVELAPILRTLVDGEVHDVAYAIAYGAPAAERHPEDGPLETQLLRVLRAIDRDAASVRLASFEGAASQQPMRVVAALRHEESVVTVAETAERRWGKRATVLLNSLDPAVRLARRRAKTEPAAAAQLLCRALLVAEGPLSAKVVDRLLEVALE